MKDKVIAIFYIVDCIFTLQYSSIPFKQLKYNLKLSVLKKPHTYTNIQIHYVYSECNTKKNFVFPFTAFYNKFVSFI